MPASPEPPTVLITGATSGIGYHTAIGLARQGAHCSSPAATKPAERKR
jgi:NAD(P)-dependent dehydrogenase (short-subunit alcohol dehydrogenase family)